MRKVVCRRKQLMADEQLVQPQRCGAGKVRRGRPPSLFDVAMLRHAIRERDRMIRQ